MSRPRIGVTGSARRGRAMWFFAWLVLRLQGCRPIRIVAPAANGVWDGLDGLLIGGGDDISAALYGMEPAPDVRVDPQRDALELEGLSHVWRRRAPILGICRGAQILNVFRGGALHQDIYEVYVMAPKMRTVLPRKHVTLTPGSRIHRIIGLDTVTVNALHHQSIRTPGEGFAITGLDESEIVQATEFRADASADPHELNGHAGGDLERFAIGVQWHPEFLFYRGSHWRLFRAFTKAVKAHKAARRVSTGSSAPVA